MSDMAGDAPLGLSQISALCPLALTPSQFFSVLLGPLANIAEPSGEADDDEE